MLDGRTLVWIQTEVRSRLNRGKNPFNTTCYHITLTLTTSWFAAARTSMLCWQVQWYCDHETRLCILWKGQLLSWFNQRETGNGSVCLYSVCTSVWVQGPTRQWMMLYLSIYLAHQEASATYAYVPLMQSYPQGYIRGFNFNQSPMSLAFGRLTGQNTACTYGSCSLTSALLIVNQWRYLSLLTLWKWSEDTRAVTDFL